jgi:hypothetical protein
MKYVKVLAENLVHHNFQYEEGLNADYVPFNPTEKCKRGGLYFCRPEDVFKYVGRGTKIAEVEVPIDARVHDEGDKLKANKIILKNIMPIEDSPLFANCNFTEKDIEKNYALLNTIKNPSEDLCRAIVKKNGFAIQYIRNPSEEVCQLAVMQDGRALPCIKNPSKEVCRLAIKSQPNLIEKYLPARLKHLFA